MKYRIPPAAALVALALLTACTPPGLQPVQAPATTAAAAGFPADSYTQAAARGQRVLRVEPGSSRITLTVRRGGTLAQFGHDHVVASQALQGFVAPGQGQADLYLALDSLTVDDAALRAEAGLNTQPSADDIAGTRANMLSKVLQTQEFPFALIHVRAPTALAGDTLLAVDITLHGMTRSFSVPARVATQPGGLRVSGMLAFEQSSFGITPFSILGGAIQVQDRVELRFDVQARDLAP